MFPPDILDCSDNLFQLQFTQQREDASIKLLKVGDLFGDHSCFHTACSDAAIHDYAIAEVDQTQVISIDYEKTKAMIMRLAEQHRFQEVTQFLAQSVPGFLNRTSNVKERIYHLFKVQHFKPGQKLVEEGQKSDCAYIIRKGEVKMVSMQIPLIINNLEKIKRNNQRVVINNQGYFSSTLNSFQIGLISERQWTADEIMILRDDPFPYSIIANSVVEVLTIQKQDLFQRMPKDIRELIECKAQMKLEWVKKCLIEICLGVESVAMWDNLQQDFLDKVKSCDKKFPATNFGAFVKILNQSQNDKPKLEQVVKSTLSEVKTIEMSRRDYRPKTSQQMRRSKSEVYQGGIFGGVVDFNKLEEQSQKVLGSARRSIQQTIQRPQSRVSIPKLLSSQQKLPANNTQSDFNKQPASARSIITNSTMTQSRGRIQLDLASTFSQQTHAVPTISSKCLLNRKTQLLLILKEKQIDKINSQRKANVESSAKKEIQAQVKTSLSKFELCGRQISALPTQRINGNFQDQFVNSIGQITPRQLVLKEQTKQGMNRTQSTFPVVQPLAQGIKKAFKQRMAVSFKRQRPTVPFAGVKLVKQGSFEDK
ncbi:hypothetical protein FGO68_gene3762 [Halteria grandinella]|uniref:Cyclic nucleotide-binding domain-containing protein n=1 Tax=Halteria grandinella TaxID=5974 RepID=A0A8J8SXY4_HALGN|nr:hypothetical protein FGO68_gene3762 [Halteria grandinella]